MKRSDRPKTNAKYRPASKPVPHANPKGNGGLFAAMSEAIWVLDADGRYLKIAPADSSLLFTLPAELVGKTLHEVFPAAQADLFLSSIRRVIDTQQTSNLEYSLQINGTETRFVGTISPMMDHSVLWVARDITARKRAEEALRESEDRYRDLVEHSQDSVCTHDLQGQILSVNPAAVRFTGYEQRDMLNKNMRDILAPEVRGEFENYLETIQRQGVASGLMLIQTRTGEKRIWEYTCTLRTKGLAAPVVDGIARDVTARKQAEQALARERYLLNALMDNIPDYIYFKDTESRFIRTNRAHAKAFGLSDPAEAVGKTDFDFFTEEHARGAYEDEQRIIRTGQPIVGLVEKETWPDRPDTWVSTTKVPLRDEKGNIVGTFGISRDITERKQAEHKLQRRANEFAALFEIARDLAAQQDLPTLLRTIVERATGLLAASGGAVFLYDAARRDLERVVTMGPMPLSAARLQLGEGAAGHVAQTRQPLIVDDYHVWEYRSPKYEGIPITAVIAVPMLYGGELIGALPVYEIGETTRKFTQADVRLLSLFASQAASVVHNARLLQEMRQRAERLALLNRIARAISGTLNLAALLEVVRQEITSVIQADAMFVALYDRATNELDFRISVDKDSPEPVGRIPFGPGLVSSIITSKKPILVHDYEQEKDHLPPVRVWGTMQIPSSWLGVPMLLGDNVIGVISVQAYRPNAYSEADQELVSTIADTIAVAVENARLFEETNRRADQLALLYDAGLTLNRVLDPRVQLEYLFKIAVKAMRADRAEFFRYDAARNEMQYELSVGYGTETHAEEVLRGLRVSIEDERGLVGWVGKHRVPLNLPDVLTDPRYIPIDPEIHSALWVPVQHENQFLGTLSVLSTRLNAFTSQDERTMALFANEAAIAMENARLFEETRHRARELELLAQVSSALRVAPSRAEMLPVILDQLLDVLRVKGAELAMRDPVSDELVIELGRGDLTQATGLRIPPGEGICGLVIATGQPYVNQDIRTDARSYRTEMHGESWAVACVPLIMQEQTVGALWVGRETPITDEEVRLLTAIADIAANAIHRATLHDQTEQRLQRIIALRVIDQTIVSSLDLKLTLNILLDHVITHLKVDAAAIFLLNPDFQTLEYAAGRGFRSKFIEGSRVRLGDDYAGRVAYEQRTVHVANLDEQDSELARLVKSANEHFVSYYSVPLIAKGQIKGVLEIYHRAVLDPDEEWLDFMQTLAGQAAIAIDNASLFEGLQRSNFELEVAYDTTIEGWSHALDLRDQETEGHTQRVTELTLQLARAVGVSDADLIHIRRGALLHDIGKMGIPDNILLKPGALDDEEWEIMRRHPTYAFELLSPVNYLHPALDIPYCHHEKWDGTGYPRGLKGEQIPLAARIFAIVDVWDALRSDRPYRPAWTAKKARENIVANTDKHFDPEVVKAFLKLVDRRELGAKLP